MDRTLVFLKPDALARGLVGDITSRFEEKGLKIIACKMAELDRSTLRDHYSHLSNEPFYDRIIKYMQSLPVIIQCWEGVDAVSAARRITGVTNGREARPGTIRGDFSMSIQNNVIHASESDEIAAEEIDRFFDDSELFSYQHPLVEYMYSSDEV